MATRSRALVLEALCRAERHLIGRSEKARSRRTHHASLHGMTPEGVVAFGMAVVVEPLSLKARVVMRVVVVTQTRRRRAAAATREIPATFGGFPTEVVAHLAHAAAALPTCLPGDEIKSALSSLTGSLLCVLFRSGQAWVVGASHVLAPPSGPPVVGAGAMMHGAVCGQLHDWDVLAGTTATDLAVARTTLSVSTTWSDGATFPPPRDYDPANGPFTVFGAVTVASGSGGTVRTTSLAINVPGVGSVSYSSVALLDFATQQGDSGAPVRDAGRCLVGMVVGGTAAGKTAITPWQSMGPRIDAMT